MSSIDVKDYHKLLASAKEKFIAERTLEEKKIEEWRVGVVGCGKSAILEKIPFDYEHVTYRILVPAAYEENLDPELIKKQIEEAKEKIDAVNQIVAEYNAEGLKLLEEYNVMK